MKRIALLACAVLLGSCAMLPPRAPPITDSQGDNVALVWIEDSPDMPAQDILDGCAYWNPMKIRCERTMDQKAAHIRVFANKESCSDKSVHKLAWAHQDGHIEMIVGCFKGFFGGIEDDKFRAVAAHEIGHELGIWEHIPSTCDPKAFDKEKQEYDKGLKIKKHPNGTNICGVAVMNPWDHGLPWLTQFDRLAFDIRDPDYRAVRDLSFHPEPNWDGCILYPPHK